MADTRATFVLSTGRCGTQWLAVALQAAAGEAARVEHEPLHGDYAPRRMLAAEDPSGLSEPRRTRVLAHVQGIEATLATRDYIETGHPCWSSLPWLARRLAGRIRVIHLVRHPVPTACSWLSHGAFVAPFLPHLKMKELISPFDAGVAFPEYRATWPDLSPLEKCLVYWAEVNAFGLRMETTDAVPWLRIRYEDLFAASGDALAPLVSFLGLPASSVTRMDRGAQVDQHRFSLAERPQLERLAAHPAVLAVAARLGYGAMDFASERLAARFLPTLSP